MLRWVCTYLSIYPCTLKHAPKAVERASKKYNSQGLILALAWTIFGAIISQPIEVVPLSLGGGSTLGVSEANYFTDMCSVSGAGSYFRLIDFVYHSPLSLRVIKKDRCFWYASPRSTLRKQEGVTTLSEGDVVTPTWRSLHRG